MGDFINVLEKIVTDESQNLEIFQSSSYAFEMATLRSRVPTFVELCVLNSFDIFARNLFAIKDVFTKPLTSFFFGGQTVLT